MLYRIYERHTIPHSDAANAEHNSFPDPSGTAVAVKGQYPVSPLRTNMVLYGQNTRTANPPRLNSRTKQMSATVVSSNAVMRAPAYRPSITVTVWKKRATSKSGT